MKLNFHPSLHGVPRRTLAVCGLVFTILLSGCDDKAIRQLGSKVGLRGQDVSSAAITALTEIKNLEPEDFSQRTVVTVVTQPMPPPKIPKVPSLSVHSEVERRIEAYQHFGKAYEAVQQLSDKDFADQAGKAQQELVNSINNLRGVPNLPSGISAILPEATSIIVERKQANAIKKFNNDLERISAAYMKLWQSDRELWKRYFGRVRSSYVNSLDSVPNDKFDQAQLRKIITEPYAPAYLPAIYKAREAARLDQRVQTLNGKLDAVDEAFRLLNKAHQKLNSQSPGFADVNAMLDRIVTVLEKVFKSN